MPFLLATARPRRRPPTATCSSSAKRHRQGTPGPRRSYPQPTCRCAPPRNCGAFSEELFASELFGHKRNAFPGAITSKGGLIETAAGGTLFLNEVSDMPASMQVAAAHHRKTRGAAPGCHRAPHRGRAPRRGQQPDLREAVRENRFRADLYYRLHVSISTCRALPGARATSRCGRDSSWRNPPPTCQQVHDITPEVTHLLQASTIPATCVT